jgi:hypothetical protein
MTLRSSRGELIKSDCVRDVLMPVSCRFGLLKKFLKSTSEPYYKVLVAEMLHSTETILGELGSPSELFLTTREVVIAPDKLESVVSVDFTPTLTRPDYEYECRYDLK